MSYGFQNEALTGTEIGEKKFKSESNGTTLNCPHPQVLIVPQGLSKFSSSSYFGLTWSHNNGTSTLR